MEVRNTPKSENLDLNTFLLFLRFQNVILEVKHNEPLLVSKKMALKPKNRSADVYKKEREHKAPEVFGEWVNETEKSRERGRMS